MTWNRSITYGNNLNNHFLKTILELFIFILHVILQNNVTLLTVLRRDQVKNLVCVTGRVIKNRVICKSHNHPSGSQSVRTTPISQEVSQCVCHIFAYLRIFFIIFFFLPCPLFTAQLLC